MYKKDLWKSLEFLPNLQHILQQDKSLIKVGESLHIETLVLNAKHIDTLVVVEGETVEDTKNRDQPTN